MKKMYISPVAEVLETRPQQIMAASGHVTESGDVVIGDGNEDEDDALNGCSRGFVDFFDTVIKTVIVLVMMTAGLTVQAQKVTPAGPPADGKTHAMTIQLKNGTQVTYTLADMSHVTYLPDVGIKVYLRNSATSVDYLFSQMDYIEYSEDSNDNANWKLTDISINCPEAWRLEYPQVSYTNLAATKDEEGAETKNQIIVKRTANYGITYSLEWDNAKIANRWTCYQLHQGNTMSATGRHDDFKSDPEVAVSPTASDYKSSGFSRGHLCPSADRLCSVEQNKQTFFLTNMQPQYQSHNGGLWGQLEELVRDFATNDNKTNSHCDTLYIVKAATITNKVTINNSEVDGIYAEKCNGRLIIPKYFYMALLHYNKATDTYQAMGFWTEHIDANQQSKNLGQYAISIDELERRTGIDFFCNLPDAIENDVEAKLDLGFWHLQQ